MYNDMCVSDGTDIGVLANIRWCVGGGTTIGVLMMVQRYICWRRYYGRYVGDGTAIGVLTTLLR